MNSSKVVGLLDERNNAFTNSTEIKSEPVLMSLATQLVSSYVQGNTLPKEELIPLLDDVFHKLTEMDQKLARKSTPPLAAVPVEESVTDDYIVCLEDGKQFKMLKKHLMAVYGMTPDDYRAKWGLPASYPMVAPNYAVKRQELARKSGLGRKRA